jgi:hypothetical protein
MVASSVLPAMVSYFLQILSLYSYSKMCRGYVAKFEEKPIAKTTFLSTVNLNNIDTANSVDGCDQNDEKRRGNSRDMDISALAITVNDPQNDVNDSNISNFELATAELFVIFAIVCLFYSAACQFQHFVGVLFVVISTAGKLTKPHNIANSMLYPCFC